MSTTTTAQSADLEVKRLLKENGAVLIRHRKHLIYKLSSGAIFVQANTPSDVRSDENNLRDLRKLLGNAPPRGMVGERREKRDRPGRSPCGVKIMPSANTAMLDALRKVSLTEDALTAKIAVLTLQLRESRRANHRKKLQLRKIQYHCQSCWGCSIRRWWKRFWRKDL